MVIREISILQRVRGIKSLTDRNLRDTMCMPAKRETFQIREKEKEIGSK
jgi:hypothetical protein